MVELYHSLASLSGSKLVESLLPGREQTQEYRKDALHNLAVDIVKKVWGDAVRAVIRLESGKPLATSKILRLGLRQRCGAGSGRLKFVFIDGDPFCATFLGGCTAHPVDSSD